MASYTTAGPDSPIAVKVLYDGCTRRAKLALRDMVPVVLNEKVRNFLCIPETNDIIIERYSDSAGSYVRLEDTNMAVYKQLYRAAKAKSKLKLRVSVQNDEAAPSTPRAVSVEEVADTPSASQSSASVAAAKQTEAAKESRLPIRPAVSGRSYDRSQLDAAAKLICQTPEQQQAFDRILNDMVNRDVNVNTRSLKLGEKSPSPPESVTKAPSATRQMPASCIRNAMFAVCCNSCDQAMPNVHYHCSTCDDGDFDLCASCVDSGITCHSPSHWMIKRTTVDGQIVNSTTETIAPKKKQPAVKPVQEPVPVEIPPPSLPAKQIFSYATALRTCNSCVDELPEKEFIHCETCDDFDLCQPCFAKDGHGHHPMHGFSPAVKGTALPEHIRAKLAPGRNQTHHALCDNCDKFITGVRHKCLDCPDWDYCSECAPNAHKTHPDHRFVPIYAPLSDATRCSTSARSIHVGICCDGPLCASGRGYPSYIRGIRYKCAVCNDLDFCANCEASPGNTHNKTHPLLKFRTPIRHVSVTTTGEHQDGQRMRPMGDRNVQESVEKVVVDIPKPTEAVRDVAPKVDYAGATVDESHEAPLEEKMVVQASPAVTVEAVKVQRAEPAPAAAVEDFKEEFERRKPEIAKPSFPIQAEEIVEAPKPAVIEAFDEKKLRASFVRDTVVDGTIMAPNHVFEQTWTLRNDGPVAWPAGCAVKYIGGDYMGHVDSNHPAEISKLVSAYESTICYDSLAPGQQFQFTVLLRTPARAGKVVSYWRLTTQDGFKFGHRLWCDVNVRARKVETPAPFVKAEPEVEKAPAAEIAIAQETEGTSLASSKMIFPTLEKESPVASMHEATGAPSTQADDTSIGGPVDESMDDEDWDISEGGFVTDDEYDILDASDEEFLEEQAKKLLK